MLRFRGVGPAIFRRSAWKVTRWGLALFNSINAPAHHSTAARSAPVGKQRSSKDFQAEEQLPTFSPRIALVQRHENHARSSGQTGNAAACFFRRLQGLKRTRKLPLRLSREPTKLTGSQRQALQFVGVYRSTWHHLQNPVNGCKTRWDSRARVPVT